MKKILKLVKAWMLGLLLSISFGAHAVEITTYYHNDLLGSPIVATDEYGNKIWTEDYQPFGERKINDKKAVNNAIGFTGKTLDVATGLNYFGARYYDPVIGRFMGIDPAYPTADNIHSFNRYAYANNNPYRYVDPDGREAIKFNFGIAGFTIGTDEASGQPFLKGRIGSVGFGLSYYNKYNFTNPAHTKSIGIYEGFDKGASSESIELNIGVSAKIGKASANLTLAEGYNRFEKIDKANGKPEYHQNRKSPSFGLDGDISFLGGKPDTKTNTPLVGVNFNANLYYESGRLITWDRFLGRD